MSENRNRATLRWDAESDAAYLDLAPGLVGRTTISSGDERVHADVKDGYLVGIEILEASTHPLLFTLIPRGVTGMVMRA